jgi:hypothetical protein
MSDSDSSRDSGDEEAELANLNVVFAASEQLRSVAVQMEQMAKMATLMSSCASKIVDLASVLSNFQSGMAEAQSRKSSSSASKKKRARRVESEESSESEEESEEEPAKGSTPKASGSAGGSAAKKQKPTISEADIGFRGHQAEDAKDKKIMFLAAGLGFKYHPDEPIASDDWRKLLFTHFHASSFAFFHKGKKMNASLLGSRWSKIVRRNLPMDLAFFKKVKSFRDAMGGSDTLDAFFAKYSWDSWE